MNSEDLDRHITGNYGEDFFEETPSGDQCEGALHYTSCWWCVYNDDGREQATGDSVIDARLEQEYRNAKGQES